MYPKTVRADLQVLRLRNFTPAQLDGLPNAFDVSGC
jgi:hypothetical protein